MRLLAWLVVAGMLTEAQQTSVQMRYLYTYGSKDGIHPPKVSNKKFAVAATGEAEHPYGLGYPVAVTTDARGRVWITDSGTNSLHRFDPNTGGYREFKRVGSTQLLQPAGITSDKQGRIYMVDTLLANVYVFDEEGEYDRVLIKRDNPLTAPTTIALSEDGRTLYVADPPKNQVVALNREGEMNGVIPLTELTREPGAICAINNQVHVLGLKQNRVEIFSPAGVRRGELQWEDVRRPTAFTYDPKRRYYLVGNPYIGVVEVLREDGHGIGAFGSRGERVDQQLRIEYLHVDPQGRVYVVDSHHGKVLVFGEVK